MLNTKKKICLKSAFLMHDTKYKIRIYNCNNKLGFSLEDLNIEIY